jgi:hypothetical protein
MARENDNRRIGIAAGGLIGLGLIGYALWKLQSDSGSKTTTTFKTNTSSDTIASSTNTNTNNTTLTGYSLKNAYWNGSQFIAYSSNDEVLDKNFDPDSINRTANIYATNMSSGIKAYSEPTGVVRYPAGKYYYEATGQIIEISADGTMTFSSDVSKPNNLSATVVNESYN